MRIHNKASMQAGSKTELFSWAMSVLLHCHGRAMVHKLEPVAGSEQPALEEHVSVTRGRVQFPLSKCSMALFRKMTKLRESRMLPWSF